VEVFDLLHRRIRVRNEMWSQMPAALDEHEVFSLFDTDGCRKIARTAMRFQGAGPAFENSLRR
jgi:hypothetical protein